MTRMYRIFDDAAATAYDITARSRSDAARKTLESYEQDADGRVSYLLTFRVQAANGLGGPATSYEFQITCIRGRNEPLLTNRSPP